MNLDYNMYINILMCEIGVKVTVGTGIVYKTCKQQSRGEGTKDFLSAFSPFFFRGKTVHGAHVQHLMGILLVPRLYDME